MKPTLGILLISLCIIHIQGEQDILKQLNKLKYNGIQSTLPKVLRKFQSMDPNKMITSKGGQLQYSWKSCGNSSYLATVNKLKISPDPILIPGNVTVEVDADLKESLQGPISLDLTIEKDEFAWIEIPCVDNIGSCFYKDICNMIPASKCPPVFKKHNLPCQCPVKAGHYSVPSTAITIPPIKIPDILKNGNYWAKATLASGTKQILCLEMYFSLASGFQ